jgi:ParB family chromosome partitioning protein
MHFVEELAAGSTSPVGRMVPLSLLEPDPNQPRQMMGELDGLVSSVRDKGVLEPILVRPLERPSKGGTPAMVLQIISGERRYRAAQIAGLTEVPVVEMNVSDEEALEIALVENLQRKDLTPFEEAEGFRVLSEKYGYTHETISEVVGKGRTVVTESMSLLRLPLQVRNLATSLGITSKSLLLELVKLDSEGAMTDLLNRVASEGLTRDDLRDALRKPRGAQRSGKGAGNRPFIFRFKAPDKSYALSLSFQRSEVDEEDLIAALEAILANLRKKS